MSNSMTNKALLVTAMAHAMSQSKYTNSHLEQEPRGNNYVSTYNKIPHTRNRFKRNKRKG